MHLRRILVIAPAAIGDAVVFNPLLKTLRANASRATLTVVAPKSLEPLIRVFPGADEIVCLDDAFYTHEGSCGPEAEQAFSKDYDLVLDTLCTRPCMTLMHRISATTKVGINFAPDEPSPYSLEIQPPSSIEDRSAVDCYLDYARALGLTELNESTAIDPTRIEPVSDVSVERLIHKIQRYRSIALLLGGGDWHKRYPSLLVTELIRTCASEYTPVLIYGPSEADEYSAHLDEWRLARNGRMHVFTGSLSNVMHILRACSGAVGNDCGLMHIAVALGIPIVSLFGPSEPVAWFPYHRQDTQRFLVSKAPCRPCYGRERELCGDNQCMAEFSPSQVWAEFAQLRLLSKDSTS